MTPLLFIPCLFIAPEPDERPTVVIVVGAPGESEYGKAFDEWSACWEQAAEKGGAQCLRVDHREAKEEDDLHHCSLSK